MGALTGLRTSFWRGQLPDERVWCPPEVIPPARAAGYDARARPKFWQILSGQARVRPARAACAPLAAHDRLCR